MSTSIDNKMSATDRSAKTIKGKMPIMPSMPSSHKMMPKKMSMPSPHKGR